MFARRLSVLVVACAMARRRCASATPRPIPANCEFSTLPSHALAKICVPSDWNGQLVVFAHGYVAERVRPARSASSTPCPDGTSLATLVQSLGFAYATTSYRQNGLAVLEGVEDIRELMTVFEASSAGPPRSFLTGASEGGLVAALVVERFPALFTGAYATCGPIGSFKLEVDYLTDFRVLFDYFFPASSRGTP